MTEVFLVSGARTPVGRFGGALASMRADDLAALVVGEALRRSGLASDEVDEVILGCANQAGDDNRNVARMAALLAGIPDSVPAYTVNRLCASGLTAVASAAQQIKAGEADVVIAGGVESMTRAPWVMARPQAAWSKPSEIVDSSLGWRFVNPRMRDLDGGSATISLGETAERVASLDGITRTESDAFSIASHRRAVEAIDHGWLDRDIVPVHTPSGVVTVDEGPRRDTTMERMASLKPSFLADGIVTPGSSSPLSDGAAAVVVASGEAVRRLGLTTRARIAGSASAGVQPSLMGLGPVPATERLLARLGLSVDDIDAIEINEAFAPQVLACVRRLGLDEGTVNSWGGAIAIGHPLGCSGARLLITLASRLEHTDAQRGLATLCVGVGQGVSMVLDRE